MKRTFKLDELGLELEVGKLARQAHGSAWLKKGGTAILTTAVMSESKDFPGFLPLMVDYREQFSAAGKIPGGYLKREGRSSDKEVLTARLIDRSIRPLFPIYFFNSVQVLSTVYSVDRNAPPSVLALLSASIALTISHIPFLEPVGAVQVGRIDGVWIMDPTGDQEVLSDVKLIIAGTKEGLCMVEGSAAGISEEEMVEAFFLAHDIIRKQVAWQEEIARELNVVKSAQHSAVFDWQNWTDKVSQYFDNLSFDEIFNAGSGKHDIDKAVKHIFDGFFVQHAEAIANESRKLELDFVIDTILKDRLASEIVVRGQRVDGRDFTTVRDISTEVGLLSSVHGSALFQRGETQALVSVTLGSGKDAQKTDDVMSDDPVESNFMLHYNFPPFSTGEVKPLRGPGRREIGHGYLAQSAIARVMPSKESFPYTTRVISDILESNGSSSMATVCGTTMALMNGGVPIKAMVGGIAMGLLEGKPGQFQAITDITGFEDALGLMDFKVAGTTEGINAIQMDIKYKGGLPRNVFEKALEQAKRARLHILGEMSKVMSEPNKEMSILVPRFYSISIDPNKVGGVIGSGGKIIKEIIEKTGTTIDIEGSDVNIYGKHKAGIDLAILWVKILADQVERGMILDGEIARTAEFGLFVDIAPGKAGLIHISKVPREMQNQLDTHYPIGMKLKVTVLEFERETGKIRLGFAS
ncbi:polyribonucleotide nucleotidyltransferase [Candidatus Babeliales bacterium]|nr:polyribonucleotide nucleotidyltransferase [Candidatus Babeliales bacterium]MBP9843630.1 polyribonucleotide nucleotidyltransferase [Candidatus Babeliales bacterium]